MASPSRPIATEEEIEILNYVGHQMARCDSLHDFCQGGRGSGNDFDQPLLKKLNGIVDAAFEHIDDLKYDNLKQLAKNILKDRFDEVAFDKINTNIKSEDLDYVASKSNFINVDDEIRYINIIATPKQLIPQTDELVFDLQIEPIEFIITKVQNCDGYYEVQYIRPGSRGSKAILRLDHEKHGIATFGGWEVVKYEPTEYVPLSFDHKSAISGFDKLLTMTVDIKYTIHKIGDLNNIQRHTGKLTDKYFTLTHLKGNNNIVTSCMCTCVFENNESITLSSDEYLARQQGGWCFGDDTAELI